MYPEGATAGGKGPKETSSRVIANKFRNSFSGRLLDHARLVLKWAPELAESVLMGAESLDKAYTVAKARAVLAHSEALAQTDQQFASPQFVRYIAV